MKSWLNLIKNKNKKSSEPLINLSQPLNGSLNSTSSSSTKTSPKLPDHHNFKWCEVEPPLSSTKCVSQLSEDSAIYSLNYNSSDPQALLDLDSATHPLYSSLDEHSCSEDKNNNENLSSSSCKFHELEEKSFNSLSNNKESYEKNKVSPISRPKLLRSISNDEMEGHKSRRIVSFPINNKDRKQTFSYKKSNQMVHVNFLNEYQIIIANDFKQKNTTFEIVRLETENFQINEFSSKPLALLRPTSKLPPTRLNNYSKCLMKELILIDMKERYLFLFDKLMIITKPKSPFLFQCKHMIDLDLFWMTSSPEPVSSESSPISMETKSSFKKKNGINENLNKCEPALFGWVEEAVLMKKFYFKSKENKYFWINLLENQLNKIETETETSLIIKIQYFENTLGLRAKKLAIRRNETIKDLLERVPVEFLPLHQNNTNKLTLGIKFKESLDIYNLNGKESLYVLQLASNRNKLFKKIDFFPIFENGSFNQNKIYDLALRRRKLNLLKYSRSLLRQRSLENSQTSVLSPCIIKLMCRLYHEGPQTLGIFRRTFSLKTLQHKLPLLEGDSNMETLDIPILMVAALLKLWLMKLKDPLLTFKLYSKWLQCGSENDLTLLLQKLKNTSSQLPPRHLELLQCFMTIFSQINKSSHTNLMTSENLAVCIGPSILRSPSKYATEQEKETLSVAIKVVRLLIEHADQIFDLRHCIQMFKDNYQSDEKRKVMEVKTDDDLESPPEEVEPNIDSCEDVFSDFNQNKKTIKLMKSHSTNSKKQVILVPKIKKQQSQTLEGKDKLMSKQYKLSSSKMEEKTVEMINHPDHPKETPQVILTRPSDFQEDILEKSSNKEVSDHSNEASLSSSSLSLDNESYKPTIDEFFLTDFVLNSLDSTDTKSSQDQYPQQQQKSPTKYKQKFTPVISYINNIPSTFSDKNYRFKYSVEVSLEDGKPTNIIHKASSHPILEEEQSTQKFCLTKNIFNPNIRNNLLPHPNSNIFASRNSQTLLDLKEENNSFDPFRRHINLRQPLQFNKFAKHSQFDCRPLLVKRPANHKSTLYLSQLDPDFVQNPQFDSNF